MTYEVIISVSLVPKTFTNTYFTLTSSLPVSVAYAVSLVVHSPSPFKDPMCHPGHTVLHTLHVWPQPKPLLCLHIFQGVGTVFLPGPWYSPWGSQLKGTYLPFFRFLILCIYLILCFPLMFVSIHLLERKDYWGQWLFYISNSYQLYDKAFTKAEVQKLWDIKKSLPLGK